MSKLLGKAVVYCRVSSVKQTVVGTGLEGQETHCREYARTKGYEVVGVFTDDVSGKLTDRPGMKAMLAFIRKHRTQGLAVIIDDVSRLARGLEAHLELRGAIAGAGGRLESPSIEFGDSPDSQLVEHLLATTAQYQRQKNAEQTRNRMRARVQNGYWVFQAPVGYRYERATGHGMVLKRDEPVAGVIQEAFEGYASGRFEKQGDVFEFIRDNPLSGKLRVRLDLEKVHYVLSNPIYAGCVEAPKWDVSRRAGRHEPLVSLNTFHAVQDRLNGGKVVARRKNVNEDFPLRGFVVCAAAQRLVQGTQRLSPLLSLSHALVPKLRQVHKARCHRRRV